MTQLVAMSTEVIPVRGSQPGKSDALNLFSVPKTDISINDFRISTFSPVGTSITPLEINVPELQEFVDLSRSYFTLKLKLTQNDGKPLKSASKVFLVNNLAHSMIKQFVVRLNGTLISPHTDNYSYKAYLETLLNFDREDGETLLRPQGWVNAIDLPQVMIKTGSSDFTPLKTSWTDNQKAAHKALKEETERYVNDTDDTIYEVQLRFKPHVEQFWFNKVLRPGVQMQFQVHFQNPSFFTYAAEETTKKLRLQESDVDMRFHLCRSRLNSSVYNNLVQGMNNMATKVNYPVVRNEIRTFTWDSKSTTRFEQEDVFQGKVPLRTVVAVLDNDAFNGHKTNYPYAFLTQKIKTVKQIVEGEEYPYETLELTGDDRNDYVGYFRWLQASGALIKSQPNMVRKKDWGEYKNCTLFMFNNVGSGNADSGMLNPHKRGVVRLEIESTGVETHISTVLVFGEFENLVETNYQVDVDYDIYH